MSLTVTSLTHPTMIAKIRKGLKLAAQGKGDEMGGHANRVYIANSKGHNIMRIDWKGDGKFVAYGGADWGQTEVTDIVKAALVRSCSSNRVAPRQSCVESSEQAKAFIAGSPSVKAHLMRLVSFLAFAFMVILPQESAFADKPPTALERTCTAQPELLVCEWILDSFAKVAKVE